MVYGLRLHGQQELLTKSDEECGGMHMRNAYEEWTPAYEECKET